MMQTIPMFRKSRYFCPPAVSRAAVCSVVSVPRLRAASAAARSCSSLRRCSELRADRSA
ncbi:hypothetical protein AB0G82_32655 [Streptomyces anulatus]|uniref:hypothetical protein n=1 Tax=Streptomyces anulatus TaxID=1892 RepID=UPI0033C9302A